MNKKIFSALLYCIHIFTWIFIINFIKKTIQYGMLKLFILHYNNVVVALFGIVAIVAMFFPFILKKIMSNKALSIPIISILLTLIIFVIWFVMMYWAITA